MCTCVWNLWSPTNVTNALHRQLLKVKLYVKPNLCTNLSSDSFSILLSSASGKLSWPATTVLLLEVVPVDEIKEQLRKKCLLWRSSSSLQWFQERTSCKIPSLKDFLHLLHNLRHSEQPSKPTPLKRRIQDIYYSQTKFLNSLTKWGYNILKTLSSWLLR